MKSLLTIGVILVALGIAAGFGYQIAVAVTTGLPTSGIGWMQATGFVVAAIGAIMIGAAIGKRRSARRAAQERSAQQR